MTDFNTHERPPDPVLVHLLDTNSGLPVQSWTFESKSSLRIGRGDEPDISVPNPYVSRHHAELRFRDGQWYLVSFGRNGVLVRNELISEYLIVDEVDFHLGAKGPLLRFQQSKLDDAANGTLSFDSDEHFLFQIDDAKVQQEVADIVDADYFQNLQSQAKLLKRQSPPKL